MAEKLRKDWNSPNVKSGNNAEKVLELAERRSVNLLKRKDTSER